MSVNNFIYFICLFEFLFFVNGNSSKGSLTFVIDDTYSMNDDIDAVKQKTHALFNAVLESNYTNIDDFILVTFNDPEVKLRVITRDPNQFRRALDDIQVHGGGDCPEFSMSGIELALEKSKPNSYFYVYTDASAKDYANFERVKSLSIKKSTKVTFLLTGECSGSYSEDFVVYNNMARATNGEVFHIEKDEVGKIIDYIIESVKEVRTTIGQKYLNEDSEKQFQFNVDTKEWDIIVSVASNGNPRFYVVGPDGKNVETKDVVDTNKNLIKKLMATEPGTYTIHLENNKKASVSVTASTSVTFKHGFSAMEPGSLKETATKPISGTRSHIAISLENPKRDVTLKTVEVIDMEDNIILELPLKLMNKDKQFYVSESFVPGKQRFKLRVVGYTNDKEKIIRLGSTTIEPQDVTLEKDIENKKPVTTIFGGPKITAEYDNALVVKCKVNAYPKPDVIWQDSSGTILPSTTVPVDLPYDYISTLELESVKNNLRVTCMALNVMGEAQTSVNIDIKNFLNILESPKDTTVPYGHTEDFQLKIDAYPSINITWYKDSKLINSHEDYKFSQNNSKLTIKDMNFNHTGNYIVRVSNGYQEENITFNVFIRAEKPKIDKSINVMTVQQGSTVNISCSIIKGYPGPQLQWLYMQDLSGEEIFLEAEGESLQITNVSTENIGTYICTAENDIGEDEHMIDLLVQYPPEIEENDEKIKVELGTSVVLPCTVVGEPTPHVKWFKNNVDISTVTKYRIYSNDNNLRFTASLDDIGVFTCAATNPLGEAKRNVQMELYSPAFIDSPAETTLYLNVGSTQKLTCNARGIPIPDVKWVFSSLHGKIRPKILSPDAENTITLSRIQFDDEGSYVCIANNTAGSTFLTYNIFVTASPVIVNNLVDKTLTGVEGDLVLRIPCMATGNPKPTITWMIEEDNIALGTEWYDTEADGTLIIKHLNKDNTGRYKCKAANTIGSTFEEFYVEVEPYPKPDEISTEILLEEGASTNVECDLPHKKEDSLRWYKGRRLIRNGELHLSNARTSDSGVYTCRVSNYVYSHSSHKRIVVGIKPKFIIEEETNIEYNEGLTVLLNCDAISDPEPTVKWFHNDQLINETIINIYRELSIEDIGTYTCNVSNKFGTISRTFKIFTKECVLNIETDFNKGQPLLTDRHGRWKILENKEGLIRIPKHNSILLICPENKITYRNNTFNEYEDAKCSDKKTFEIKRKGKILFVDFTELKCLKENRPLAKISEVQCGPANENTELMTVGFSMRKKFLGVYNVCIDKDRKVPIYAKHTLTKSFANKIPKTISHIDYRSSTHLPFDFDYMYQCITERYSFETCCYTKTQLISPRDVLPGLPQVATYNYLNIVPHWSTCSTENWDEIERRVRVLTQDLDTNLEVWTGSSSPLRPPALSTYTDAYLTDKSDLRQPIGPFIWKVVINPEGREALAIIQLNVRDLSLSEAAMLLPCRDICHKVEWMKHTEWYNVDKGFTFCCSIEDFKSAFGFKHQFKNVRDILMNHSVPKYSLT